MRLLRVVCKGCRTSFASGIPLRREHLEGVKIRSLEVCPACGTAADYGAGDYLEPDDAPGRGGAAGEAPPDIPGAPA